MTYEILIATIQEIVENDLIYKENLILEYSLSEELHMKLEEHFYYKTDAKDLVEFENTIEFEVEIGGILVRFVRDE